MRNLAAVGVIATVVALVAGCSARPATTGAGGSVGVPAAGASAPPAGPTPVASRCGPPDAPAKTFALSTSDHVTIAAVEIGTGARGVVLVPELGRTNLCGWWEYAAFLAAKGYHVLLFDHRCAGQSTCPAGDPAPNGLMLDIGAAVSRLRSDGASKVVLMGASQGASEALIAGAAPPSGATGVIALSADGLTDPLAAAPYPADPMLAAPKLRLPVLLAVADADIFVSVAETQALYRALGSAHRQILVVPAVQGHGWTMLEATTTTGVRPPLSAAVVSFLSGHLK